MGNDSEHVQTLNRLVLAQGARLVELREQMDLDRGAVRQLADEVSRIRRALDSTLGELSERFDEVQP